MDGKLDQIKELGCERKCIFDEFVLNVEVKDALVWVLKAPVLGIVLNSLELTKFSILIVQVNKSCEGFLSALDIN